MKTVLEDMSKCTGCRACEKSCSFHSITMEKNEEGFLYPVINQITCVDCGRCREVCPVENEMGTKPLAVYAAVHRDEDVLMNSSSGGMFTAIAQLILDSDGIVFGCVVDPEFNVIQTSAKNMYELAQMRGSKYVQSDTLDTYLEVENLLIEGQQVLYTGTPCQIAGLKAHLGKDHHNLLTVDLVCHGVPSPDLFKAHIRWLESRCQGKLNSYRFRTKIKAKGQDNLTFYHYSYNGDGNYRQGPANLDPYYKAFRQKRTYRESCYQCSFACPERSGDFTIADFWKVEQFHPELKKTTGVSILCINSQKGMETFVGFKDQLRLIESNIDDVQKVNTNLREPSSRPSDRDVFYNCIAERGYDAWANDYLKSLEYKFRWLYEGLPRFIRIPMKKAFIRLTK